MYVYKSTSIIFSGALRNLQAFYNLDILTIHRIFLNQTGLIISFDFLGTLSPNAVTFAAGTTYLINFCVDTVKNFAELNAT